MEGGTLEFRDYVRHCEERIQLAVLINLLANACMLAYADTALDM